MNFYDLPKYKRVALVERIKQEIFTDLENNTSARLHKYFSDNDTYIRKTAYFAIGKFYFAHKNLQTKILRVLKNLFQNKNEKVRQTAVNALGEIGKREADKVLPVFEKAFLDSHYSVRNAVIGSLKKMGEKNQKPVLAFSKRFLHDQNPEVRRQAVHGIELRGRTHPEEVLPLLSQLQDETDRRVRNMVIHVLGQISYKEGCLGKVVAALGKWKNKEMVKHAIKEILDTHKSYEKFSAKSYQEAKEYLWTTHL